jgi:ribosomal protein S12 methylthiotransferase
MGHAENKHSQRVGVISLGCPKNLVDTEIMLGELDKGGHRIVQDIGQAETVIINTCGFIDQAKEESINTILEIAEKKGKGVQRLLVAGCMVNRYGSELAAAIPEIDGFIGLDDLHQVGSLMQKPAATKDGSLVQLGGSTSRDVPASQSHMVFDHTAPRLLTTHGYAYLKVAEGCNNPCTFCAIPDWRGRFRSRSIESLVQEARRLQDEGIQELCLIAQDTTRYGEDLAYGKHGLLRLVEALLEGTDIPWIRFLYAYPTTLDQGLMRLMGQTERFVSYVDMPLQHSHPDILKAMRRGGRAERYLRQLRQARELAPDIFLRSTFIVGFPGETEEHFEHLLEFVAEAELDHLGAFIYSPEPGTPSAELSGRVPSGKAQRRHDRLMAVQEPISRRHRQALVGRRLQVLVHGVCAESEHLLEGRHHGLAPEIDGRVLINDGIAPAGTFAEVEITEAFADDIVGRIVGPEGVPGVTPAPH